MAPSLDLLPGVCGEVKNPEVFIVVELLPVRRRKLPSKQPQLPPCLGNYHRLQRERKRDRKEREREKDGESWQ